MFGEKIMETERLLGLTVGSMTKVYADAETLAEETENSMLSDERFHLTPEALEELLDVRQFVGLAPEQTRAFLKTHVYPVLEARRGDIAGSVPVRV